FAFILGSLNSGSGATLDPGRSDGRRGVSPEQMARSSVVPSAGMKVVLDCCGMLQYSMSTAQSCFCPG
ncbi:unnamed protein product, partial [Symbiodinium sp. CCMP2456]